jgi:hypothetical protein
MRYTTEDLQAHGILGADEILIPDSEIGQPTFKTVEYSVATTTGTVDHAGTNADVRLWLRDTGDNEYYIGKLDNAGNDRKPGQLDKYTIFGPSVLAMDDIGFMLIRNEGGSATGWHWYCGRVRIFNEDIGRGMVVNDFGWIRRELRTVYRHNDNVIHFMKKR